MNKEYHDNLMKNIKESIEYHEKEHGFRTFTFYFTAPKYDWRAAADDPCVNEVVNAFKSAGYNPQMCDTVPHAANLNRDWWEVDNVKTIREFGFTLPVLEDLEAMIRIVELENSGEVQFIVYDLDNE